MNRSPFYLLLFILSLGSCENSNPISIQLPQLTITINEKGFLQSLTDNNQTPFLSASETSPLITLMKDTVVFLPQQAEMLTDSSLRLSFGENQSVTLTYTHHNNYLKWEVTDFQGSADLLTWGPYHTNIKKTIGETVGVVRNDEFAIGIQSLNEKTLGGYPWTNNDCMPQIDIFDQDNPADLSEEGKRYVLYRVEAAKPTENGSSLQAYVRERDEERTVPNLAREYYTSPVFTDGGIVGSSIAMFGTTPEQVLDVISSIELTEHLPHPKIEGEWVKKSTKAHEAYLITEFGEETIDEAIALVKKAGLRYLYHSGPFKNWGHFELREEQFPNGWEGLKACVDKAAKEGVFIGVHTLSNFITTDDPYVTPVPDKRLGKVGSSTITSAISSNDSEIPIDSPLFFAQYKNNSLKTVMIGEELIRYEKVSEEKPWRLLNAVRGAYGTTPGSYTNGEAIHMLADHAYKVFLTDPELGKEMAERLGRLFNETGLRQISFDGVEGNRSTGMGNYGEILFTTTWYNELNEDIQNHLIADASRTSHYFWHIYSRMNWGEPWYAGFRESQAEYRFKNQAYFQRNYMPGMLGWFRLDENTTLEDVEWMLARATGYDAGYGFVVSLENWDKNGRAEEILEALNVWEQLRMEGKATERQKEEMRKLAFEFTARRVNGDIFISTIHSQKGEHLQKVRQPGEPLYSTFAIENQWEEQSLSFIVTAKEGSIEHFTLELDQFKTLEFNVSLGKGESFHYNGKDTAIIYDASQNIREKLPLDVAVPQISSGDHTVVFDASFTSNKEGKLGIEFRLSSKGLELP